MPTEADRRTEAVKLRLTPERAARLRTLGAGTPGGASGAVSAWLDGLAPADVMSEVDEAADARAQREEP